MFVTQNKEASEAAALAATLSQVWLANQMASSQTAAVPTGFRLFDHELPGGGWPGGTLTELMSQRAGIGEIRLLLPALRRISRYRRIALVTPPHRPQLAAWTIGGVDAERILWIRAARSADALWAAEQILRNGSCGALLCWQPHMRNESLRRLHLAAQASDMVFWLFRPLAAAQDASPAPLRLALRPVAGGISVEIVKRRGPRREGYLVLPLASMPIIPATIPTGADHAPVDLRAPADALARDIAPVLV